MPEAATLFSPPKRRGLFLLSGLLLLCLALGSGLLFLATQQPAGVSFMALLLGALLLLTPVPLLAYCIYALFQAVYSLGRDGLRLRWGLRAEDIPFDQVEWVRPAAEAGLVLPRPLLALPGAFLGSRNSPDLGPIEYLASSEEGLLLIATPARVYVISPEDPKTFLRTFRDSVEMGSLSPMSAFSARPAAFVQELWLLLPIRILFLSALALNLMLFIATSILIPQRQSVSLGFDPTGQPLPPGPAASLLLLPVLSSLSLVGDWLLGMFFYRRSEQRLISYLLWGTSALLPILLLLSLFFL